MEERKKTKEEKDEKVRVEKYLKGNSRKRVLPDQAGFGIGHRRINHTNKRLPLVQTQ